MLDYHYWQARLKNLYWSNIPYLHASAQNPYWGTPEEVFEKVEEFWKTNYIEIVPPVEGAPEGIKKLRELGYRLIVVTARQRREMDRGKKWLDTHFPDMFDGIICTGQSQETLGE